MRRSPYAWRLWPTRRTSRSRCAGHTRMTWAPVQPAATGAGAAAGAVAGTGDPSAGDPSAGDPNTVAAATPETITAVQRCLFMSVPFATPDVACVRRPCPGIVAAASCRRLDAEATVIVKASSHIATRSLRDHLSTTETLTGRRGRVARTHSALPPAGPLAPGARPARSPRPGCVRRRQPVRRPPAPL